MMLQATFSLLLCFSQYVCKLNVLETMAAKNQGRDTQKTLNSWWEIKTEVRCSQEEVFAFGCSDNIHPLQVIHQENALKGTQTQCCCHVKTLHVLLTPVLLVGSPRWRWCRDYNIIINIHQSSEYQWWECDQTLGTDSGQFFADAFKELHSLAWKELYNIGLIAFTSQMISQTLHHHWLLRDVYCWYVLWCTEGLDGL